MQTFAEETGVFGLNLLRSSVPNREKLLWLLITGAFAIATVRDLSNLVKTYVEGDTVVSVTVGVQDEIRFDPAPMVYFQLADNFMECSNFEANLTLLRESLKLVSGSQTAQAFGEEMPFEVLAANLRLLFHITGRDGHDEVWVPPYL